MHHHGESLRRLKLDPETIDALKLDYSKARLEPRHQALLAYAQKLATMPWKVVPEDLEELRRAGYDDAAIHDAALVVAYFSFANRLADGLGVELETGPARDADA